MKKFILKLLLFGVICIVADRVCGLGINALERKARTGTMKKTYDVNNTAEADVLILGSSRCTHHYHPKMLEDSLGLDTYIAGQDGNGIVLMYPRYHIMRNRRKPQLVIYDLSSGFDVQEDDLHTYLRFLRPLYGKVEVVDEVIDMVDPTEKYKLNSDLFRNNSQILTIARATLPDANAFYNGYLALTTPYVGTGEVVPVSYPGPDSPEKIRLLERLAEDCRADSVKMILVMSPMFGGADKSLKALGLRISETMGVPLLDYSSDEEFVGNTEYFTDNSHLNDHGARRFTEIILPRLREALDVEGIER